MTSTEMEELHQKLLPECDGCGRKLQQDDGDCDQDGFYPIFEKCDCEER